MKRKLHNMKLREQSLERSVADRLAAGETLITLTALPPQSARHIVSELARWWRDESPKHDADAVVDTHRCEASGWTDETSEYKGVDWRVIIPTLETPIEARA